MNDAWSAPALDLEKPILPEPVKIKKARPVKAPPNHALPEPDGTQLNQPELDCLNKPIHDFRKIPSVFQQTSWPMGGFNLPEERETRWFNPSITHYNGADWLCVRKSVGEPRPLGKNSLVLFRLEGKVIVQRHDISFIKAFQHEHWEDPRLAVMSNELFVSCCNFRICNNYHAHQILAHLNTSRHPETIHPIYGKNQFNMDTNTGNEKNWVWFHHPEGMHFVYEPWPHHVVKTNVGAPVQSYIQPTAPCPWAYGQMRGGSPPIVAYGLFWSFFHSSIDGDQSKGEPRRRYFMGCYCFDYDPPFKPRAITLQPLLIGSEQDGGVLPVVFPGGSTIRDGVWTVVFGVNDLKSAWVDIPHSDLVNRMTSL